MTNSVPVWYQQQWANNVILRYQSKGYSLQGTVMPPVDIKGDKFYFLRSGSVEAQEYTRGDAVGVLDPEDDKVSVEAREWDAAVPIYDWDVTKISVDERQLRQAQCALALGRRSDLIIYDEIMNATIPAGNIFGAYTDPIDPYLIKQGLQRLFDNDVDVAAGVFCPMPSLAYGQMETYPIFANADWIGGNLPLTKMTKHRSWDVGHFFQMQPHLVKAYTSGTQLRFRVWCKSAVGAGSDRKNIRPEWTREGLKKRWIVNHTINGGCKVVQPEGIVEFRMKADSVIEEHAQLTRAA